MTDDENEQPICPHSTRPDASPAMCSLCQDATPKRLRPAGAVGAWLTDQDARLSGAARAESHRSISRERQ